MRQRVKVSGTEAAWSAFEAEAMPHAPGLFRLELAAYANARGIGRMER
jgi:hypothetical protein